MHKRYLFDFKSQHKMKNEIWKDRSIFESEKAFNTAFNKTQKPIRYFGRQKSHCGDLCSGNGYHIYQPLEAFPLKQEELFASKSIEPSKEFLQFAERYLTNYKSDLSHHPSIRSCMVRVPASHNFKIMILQTNQSSR